jgi:CII-binding regulator of phage lambda lysogenization HflD
MGTKDINYNDNEVIVLKEMLKRYETSLLMKEKEKEFEKKAKVAKMQEIKAIREQVDQQKEQIDKFIMEKAKIQKDQKK